MPQNSCHIARNVNQQKHLQQSLENQCPQAQLLDTQQEAHRPCACWGCCSNSMMDSDRFLPRNLQKKTNDRWMPKWPSFGTSISFWANFCVNWQLWNSKPCYLEDNNPRMVQLVFKIFIYVVRRKKIQYFNVVYFISLLPISPNFFGGEVVVPGIPGPR